MINETLFDLQDITGSGKKPKQHTPVEYPDTGSSTQVAKLLIMLSEGEIEGFETSDVYLRQVPATEYSVDVESRRGLPGQEVIPGFAEVYAPLAATSAAIKYGDGIGQHVIIAVPNTNDAVILTQTINALYKVESNGDTVGNTVELTYYTSLTGADGAWVTSANKKITAKYSSGYAFSVTVNRPAGTPSGNVWYAKIVRNTEDSTSNKNQNATSFSQAIGIIYKSLSYDYKALLGITLKDAKQFGGNIPEILVRAKGIKVSIPNNYTVGANGIGGTYAGTWTGTFAEARSFTCNPAWCLLHCLTDARVGLGLDPDDIDIFAFYDLATYCDGLVNISNVSVSINEIPNETASFTRVDGTFTMSNTTPTANANAIAFRIFGKEGEFVGQDGVEIISVNKQIGAATIVTVSLGSYTHFRVEAINQNTIGSSASPSQEPRYTINAQFITRENLSTFFMYFLTLMNANWTTNEFGQLSVMWDNKDQQPTKQVTNATVIDGIFNYSSTDIEQRFNHVNVTFSDPTAFGRTNTISVPEVDAEGIGLTAIDRAAIHAQSRYGFQQLDLVLVGCTSRAQAIRKARWALYNSCFLYNIIDFKVLFEGMIYKVGEIISVCDNFNQEELIAGMIVSHEVLPANPNDWTVVFDRDINIITEEDVGTTVSYTMTYLLKSDGSQRTIELTLTEGSILNSILIPTAEPLDEPLDSSFIIHPTAVKPKLYKVIKITKEEEVHSIVAIEHHDGVHQLGYNITNDLSKYDYIDGTVTINKPSGDYSNIAYEIVNPIPDNSISVTRSYSIDINTNQVVKNLEVKWEAPANPILVDGKLDNRLFNYHIVVTRIGVQEEAEVPSPNYTVKNLTSFGEYKIQVAVVDATNGRTSASKEYIYNYSTDGVSTLLPPTNLVIKGTNVTTFKESDAEITWEYNPANDSLNNGTPEDTLFTYLLEIWDWQGLTKLYNKDINIPFDKDELSPLYKGGTTWIGLTASQELAITPYRKFMFKVYSVDADGAKSATALEAVFEKLEPPALEPTDFTVTNTGSQFKVLIDNAGGQGYGITHYNVYASVTNGFTPSSSNLVGTKKFDPLLPMESFSSIWFDFPAALTAGTPVYVLVESSDSFIGV